MAAVSAAESQKSRRTFEVGLTSSADALRLIIRIAEEWKYGTQELSQYGNGHCDKKVVDRYCGMQSLLCCSVL